MAHRQIRPVRRWPSTRWLASGLAAVLVGCGGGGGGNADTTPGGTGGTGGTGASGAAGTTLTVDASPLRATLAADTARSVTQTVSPTGGTVTATGADGTVFTLTVPADAMVQAIDITMTPLSSVSVPGLATGAGYGVQLGPEGASFLDFVTLTITPPAGASAPIERQIPIGWSGADNTVSLAALDPAAREVKLKLMHFSGYALLLATTGTNATLEPVRHRFGGDAEARLQSLAAERLAQERQRQLLGQAPAELLLDDIFKAYDEQVVKPRVAAAGSSCAAGRLAIQTVLGTARQRQLLGYADDGSAQDALGGSLMSVATAACTREEYALCRDEHIITRMLPYYLGLSRQAQLLGLSDGKGVEPTWLQDAEAATAKCLNFELQIDSDLRFSGGTDQYARNVNETVSARLPMPFNLGVSVFASGGLFVSGTVAEVPLVSSNYTVYYPNTCASVSGVQGVNAGILGNLGFTAQSGGVAQRALVQDFVFSPAVVPHGFGSGYSRTLRTPRSSGGCENDPSTSPQYDNWVINGYPTWLESLADPNFGLAIRNWTIVGGDVMATKEFTTSTSENGDSATVTTRLVLFHKPAP
ncbi:hypothetical protein RD110_23935 [Rhodoferax koreense]|uniref:Uncharacterized protein n=1 Tax=Rhodoferax koreensis TaxID=1842727 RepID=A0A1P8K1J8_9BURK|nr:DUF4402 domain-containing protein [Rhodoferax koreense]APW39880.1 hypothetical protein RD110_23935 [Rhodoferax koreense]